MGLATDSDKTRVQRYPQGISRIVDVPYKEASGTDMIHPKNHLDIYLPSDVDIASNSVKSLKKPVILFVHGGGWRRGDKGDHKLWGHSHVGRAFASEGFVCVVMSYRLSAMSLKSVLTVSLIWAAVLTLLAMILYVPASFSIPSAGNWMYTYLGMYCFAIVIYKLTEPSNPVKYPGHVEDVAHASKWVFDNIKQYGGDKQSVFLCGHSAGAQLVTLFALEHSHAEGVGISRDELLKRVKGVIGISGPYNVPRMATADSFKQWLARHVYALPAFGEREEVYTRASPSVHVKKHHNAGNGLPIPFLLMNAETDHWLHKDAAELKGELEKNGFKVKYHVVPGKNHRSIVFHIGTPQDATTKVVAEFVRQHHT